MKVAAIINYIEDSEKTKASFPAHRAYFRTFLEDGRLLAAGPFKDESGALWILDVETIGEAEEMVKGDPSVADGVFVSWKIIPFAYWSAKESKGR